MSVCKMLLLLLLLTVMLLSRAQAQSGERDIDMAMMSCTSHISMYEGSNISCQLIPRHNDLQDDEDDDDNADAIVKMKACCCDLIGKRCVEGTGDTLSSKDLNPLSPILLTVLSKRGYRTEKSIDLRKIIKPKRPQVYNVTLNLDQATVHVQTPYKADYLNNETLHFQLQLWSETTNQTQNMTADSMNIGLIHLRSGTQYHTKVRAIPRKYFQGTWSEWSKPYSFHIPPSFFSKLTSVTGSVHQGSDSQEWSVMLWYLISVLLVVVSAGFICKKKILTYMWPSVPTPKTTLKQKRGPNNCLLLFYIPEDFSSLNVHTSVSQSAGPSYAEKEPTLPSVSTGANELLSWSPQSPDTPLSTSSVGTEELELLSQSSTSGDEPDVTDDLTENSLYLEEPETSPAKHNGTQNEKDNSYVTMSSFYQIKTVSTAVRTAPMRHFVTV